MEGIEYDGQLKAIYSDGVLAPLEPLDREDGAEVTLHVENGTSQGEALKKPDAEIPYDPDAPSILELFRKIREPVPESAWADLPTNGAKNYKSYLYGWPKEDEW